MENIRECIEKILSDYLKENGFTLYDVKWTKEYGFKTLMVLVDKKEGITVEELSLVNEYLSERLDQEEIDDKTYMLEVSSPGAEKPLRNEEELKEAIGSYVHVKTDETELEGYLLEVENDSIKLKINVKGRIKEMIVKRETIKKARLAIKF